MTKNIIAIQQSHDPIQRNSLVESMRKVNNIFSGITGFCDTTLPENAIFHSRLFFIAEVLCTIWLSKAIIQTENKSNVAVLIRKGGYMSF